MVLGISIQYDNELLSVGNAYTMRTVSAGEEIWTHQGRKQFSPRGRWKLCKVGLHRLAGVQLHLVIMKTPQKKGPAPVHHESKSPLTRDSHEYDALFN